MHAAGQGALTPQQAWNILSPEQIEIQERLVQFSITMAATSYGGKNQNPRTF